MDGVSTPRYPPRRPRMAPQLMPSHASDPQAADPRNMQPHDDKDAPTAHHHHLLLLLLLGRHDPVPPAPRGGPAVGTGVEGAWSVRTQLALPWQAIEENDGSRADLCGYSSDGGFVVPDEVFAAEEEFGGQPQQGHGKQAASDTTNLVGGAPDAAPAEPHRKTKDQLTPPQHDYDRDLVCGNFRWKHLKFLCAKAEKAVVLLVGAGFTYLLSSKIIDHGWHGQIALPIVCKTTKVLGWDLGDECAIAKVSTGPRTGGDTTRRGKSRPETCATSASALYADLDHSGCMDTDTAAAYLVEDFDTGTSKLSDGAKSALVESCATRMAEKSTDPFSKLCCGDKLSERLVPLVDCLADNNVAAQKWMTCAEAELQSRSCK